MKNQYFGDVGDYGKYAMLRYLGENDIKIAVNWYLTSDDGSNDGKFITYLNKAEMRDYDGPLFDLLKDMVAKNQRSIEQFEKADVIKGAKYYNSALRQDRAYRKEWHQRALAACADVNLVFLDPDNGITENGSAKGANKYCVPEEVADYYNAGQNVVYYCQKARRNPEQWENTKRLMQKYLPDCRIFVITYHKGTQRSYIFVIHEKDYGRYTTLMRQFCHKWNHIFTEE